MKTAKQINDQLTGSITPIILPQKRKRYKHEIVTCLFDIPYPKWKNNPDSEGWWWFIDETGEKHCFYISEDLVHGFCYHDEAGKHQFPKFIKDKWIKAIVPEPMKEENAKAR